MQRHRPFALLIAVMLVAAACSASTGTTDTTGTPTTAPAAEAHETGEAHEEEAHEEEAHEEEAHEEEAHEEEAHEEGDEHDTAMDAMFASVEHFPEATGEVTSELTVTMTEFGFDPATIDLTPGETVRFVLVNNGVLGHEFRLTTEHKAEEHLASGHEDHGEGAEDGHHEGADIIVNVAPGETRIVEMTLPDDPAAIDHMACLIPGHYEGGMFGTVI